MVKNIVIADTCSLILLEKADLLNKLLKINKITIPVAVYEETVINGIKRDFPDAYQIQEYINKKLIKVKKIEKIKTYKIKIQRGELEAINLYRKLKANLLITDDKKAMKICINEKINYTTTLQIIIDMKNNKIITKKEALNSIEIISKKGRYKAELLFNASKIIRGE